MSMLPVQARLYAELLTTDDVAGLILRLDAIVDCVPDLRELDDWLDHAPDCGALRLGEGWSCECGYAVQRAGLRKAIRTLEGKDDA